MWTTPSTSRVEEEYRAYAQNLISLWREYYPGYDQALCNLSESDRRAHFNRVYIAWSCEKLAWELAQAQRLRWPFRNRFWLEHVLSRGIPIQTLADMTRAPAWLVRFYAWRYGLGPSSLLWVLTGRGEEPMLPEQTRPAITAQAAFSDWIFVLPEGRKIFIPAEDYLDTTERVPSRSR